MSRMLVCGDRNWLKRVNDEGLIDHTKVQHIKNISFDAFDLIADAYGVDILMEGCAPGADHLAEEWSEQRSDIIREHIHFPAEWDKYRPGNGKKNPAGPIRNRKMLEEGQPDYVLALHDNIEKSKGTKDMVRIAQQAGVPLLIVTTDALEELQNAIR